MNAGTRILPWSLSPAPGGAARESGLDVRIAGCEVSQPVATGVVHVFNHRTHQRGPVHAMLTAAGAWTAGTDLVFMPELV